MSALGLHIEGSPVEPYIQRLKRELAAKKLKFRPSFYLTDSWGCPDEVPVIGVPFYLTDKRLMRLEEEQTGEIEDSAATMMLLRHETGHAINYAYRLWEDPGWSEVFGPFSKPYRDIFRPNPMSRHFVRHLTSSQYGCNYAQKHPDEDFAETFAVWLAPRSAWRRKYRIWPVLRKLKFIDQMMQEIRTAPPCQYGGKLVRPIEAIDIPLAEHYGQLAERFRATAQGYVDDKLKEIFPPVHRCFRMPVARLLDQYYQPLASHITRWSGLEENEVRAILNKLRDRVEALKLECPRRQARAKLIHLTSMATSLAMDFAYIGQFVG